MNEQIENELTAIMIMFFSFIAFAFIWIRASNRLLGKTNIGIAFLTSFIFSLFVGYFYYSDETEQIEHEYTYKNNWCDINDRP